MVYKKKEAGEKIVTLSLGEGFFDLPTIELTSSLMEKGAHYIDGRGLPLLRKNLADLYSERYKSKVVENEILITSGSKLALFEIFLSLLKTNQTVAVFEPAWLSYKAQIQLAKLTPQLIPEDIEVDCLQSFLAADTGAIIINNPNNPSGVSKSKKYLLDLFNFCQEREILLISDEAYSEFYSNDEFLSLASFKGVTDYLVIVNSLSKSFGLSGWRIGYAILSGHNMEKVVPINQHLATCAPALLQVLIAENFQKLKEVCFPQAKEMTLKAIRLRKFAENLGLECTQSDSTFYFLVKVGNSKFDDFDFCMNLLEKNGIATVPGSAYGEGARGFIRVGVGKEKEADIMDAITTISEIVNKSSN